MIVFILANSIVYGLIFGFLFSWVSASAGAILVFILIRKLEKKFHWVERLKEQKQVNRVISFLTVMDLDRYSYYYVFHFHHQPL